MRSFAIQAHNEDEERIFSHYLKGKMVSSFLFRGCLEKEDTAFYVTHGQEGKDGGYLVMDCSGFRNKTYTQEEFAFYMNGLLEYNPSFKGIASIVTIECYGGYHRPSELKIGDKTIPMRPLSPEKEVLWVAWRKKEGALFLICIGYSDNEYAGLRDEEKIDEAVALAIKRVLKKTNPNLGYQEWKE